MTKLSLAQTRFLSERLLLPDFARASRDSPATFFNDLVRAFKANVPFTRIHIANGIRRHGAPLISKDVFDREIFNGLGGSCAACNSVLHDLASAMGFESRILSGFSFARSKKREALHFALLVKVEGQTFFCDAGTFVPLCDAVRLDPTSPVSQTSVHGSLVPYRVFFDEMGVALNADFLDSTTRWAPSFDPKELWADLRAERLKIVVAVEKNEITATVIPHLDKVNNGDWLPLNVLIDFSDFEEMKYLASKQVRMGPHLLIVSGIGSKTKDFVIVTPRRFLNRITIDGEPRLQMTELVSCDEALEIVAEEFPQLRDYFKKVLDFANL